MTAPETVPKSQNEIYETTPGNVEATAVEPAFQSTMATEDGASPAPVPPFDSTASTQTRMLPPLPDRNIPKVGSVSGMIIFPAVTTRISTIQQRLKPRLFFVDINTQAKLEEQGTLDQATTLRLHQSASIWQLFETLITTLKINHGTALLLTEHKNIRETAIILRNFTLAVYSLLQTESVAHLCSTYSLLTQWIAASDKHDDFPVSLAFPLRNEPLKYSPITVPANPANVKNFQTILSIHKTFMADMAKYISAEECDLSTLKNQNVIEIIYNGTFVSEGWKFDADKNSILKSCQLIPKGNEALAYHLRSTQYPPDLLLHGMEALYRRIIKEALFEKNSIRAIADFRIIFETILRPTEKYDGDVMNIMSNLIACLFDTSPFLFRDQPFDTYFFPFACRPQVEEALEFTQDAFERANRKKMPNLISVTLYKLDDGSPWTHIATLKLTDNDLLDRAIQSANQQALTITAEWIQDSN